MQTWVAAGFPYGGPAIVRHPLVFVPEAITERAKAVLTGRANTHARAVVPSSPVHEQPISCTTSLPTPAISTSSPFPYDESDAGLPPMASSPASSGTSWQNSIRGSSISTVLRLAIGVGAGSGAAFSSSLQPVITTRARSAAGTVRIGRRADERSMRYTVGVLTYARPA